ncbi:MAG: hypothetical protein JY451_09470 [Erythrobacter sp.]|nr:MAG: hypothetical protein JY451_09470 [Erythrobacter sp.]
MTKSALSLTLAAAAAAIVVPATLAAHHGWGWTQDEESRISGQIVSISFGNPHMQVQLRRELGGFGGSEIWNVDLSPPIVAERSGFGPDHAAAGDEAIITGHRARDMDVRAFKGETITVRGQTFNVYPQREITLQPE